MWKAFVFGAVVAGAIGPIALLVFGTAARQGFAAGAFAGLGAALADFLFALAAFSIGALVMPLVAAHEKPIAVACALLLIGLGAAMLFRLAQGGEEAIVPRPAAQALMPTFLLTIVNPMTLVVFAGIVPQLPVAGSFGKAAALALALAAGSSAIQLAIAGTGAALGRAMPGENGRRAVTAAAAAGIVAFGIYGLASAF
jgi:threonine/homoserine/homoserine lactone efflux protein